MRAQVNVKVMRERGKTAAAAAVPVLLPSNYRPASAVSLVT